MQEYYIRNPDSEESRGPFNVDQLTSLAETGHITLETYIYNVEIEQWEILESNDALRATIFPEKKRLTVKPKVEFDSLNKNEVELPPVTVDDLLAAAEGLTEETKHKKQASVWREKAAWLGMYVSGAALILSALGLLWLERSLLLAFDFGEMVTSPLLIVAVADLVVALLLFLQTTAVYPLMRFRTMLGAGFFFTFFWAADQPLIGAAVALGSLGIYGLTLFVGIIPFLISASLAFFGMLAFVIFALGI